MNDDCANRELSFGELEAVAGGVMMNHGPYPTPSDPIIHPKVLPAPARAWMGGLPGMGGANGYPF